MYKEKNMDKRITNAEQIAYAREACGRFGKMLYVKCGRLSLSLNVDRCLDIYDLSYAGDNLAFLSSVGLNPYSLETDFLSRFEGGFLYTSGLENIGGPTETAALHGSFHCRRATLTLVETDVDRVTVSGIIDFSGLFCDKIKVKRTYEITENSITLTDEFIITSGDSARIMQLYHFNIGYPLLDEGVRITLPSESVIPRDDHAKLGIDTMYTFSAPIDNLDERCYICSSENPESQASIENEKLGRKLTITYDGRVLPKFVEWKSERSGDYALGLEPCTTHLDNKEYTVVKSGDKHILTIDIR